MQLLNFQLSHLEGSAALGAQSKDPVKVWHDKTSGQTQYLFALLDSAGLRRDWAAGILPSATS